jgi:exopolyphosphatase/guanosine-5'-triphosphate,3'-diphosphate pyrophosphatase
MPRYAAIDIGSNSTRLAVAEVNPGEPWKMLATDREVTRLGTSVFTEGAISKEAMELLIRTLSRFAATYHRLGATGVRAVATSAVRDARNQQDFLFRASQAAGAPVEIISGLEESRLINAGVHATWPLPEERVLIIDIGGGSAEVIVSDGGKLESGISRPLGAVRLKEMFLQGDPPAREQLERLYAYINEKLAPAMKRTGLGRFDRAIATSSTAAAVISALNKIPRKDRDRADRLSATTADIGDLENFLAKSNLAARRKVPGIGPRRAEIIVAGISVLHRILKAYGQTEVFYSTAGVRDGIIADLAERRSGSDLTRMSKEQRQVIEAMARRYAVDMKHARQTAHLANSLFVGLQPLHQLPASAGKLLEAAAYLLDSGHYVSDMAHHKHSYYLVANGDLPAFTNEERQTIALLCRFHRKSMPQARHGFFQDLTAAVKKTVLWLVPIVRLADSLAGSPDHHAESARVHISPKSVTILLEEEGDINLELWAGERVADVFRQIYGRELALKLAS